MVDKFDAGRQPLAPLRPERVSRRPANVRPGAKPSAETSFAEVLKRETTATSLKFSAHAAQRMRDRNIQLSEADLMRLQDAVLRAQAKVRESPGMMEKAAFVVSIRTRLSLLRWTASMRQNVFTNIDSAVIV